MKTILIALTMLLGFSAFAEEIPVPTKVVTFNNPTLNGLSFAAIFAHDYQTDAELGGLDLDRMATNSARLICLFMGYDRVYTYSLAKLAVPAATVLYMDQNLVATPVETKWEGGYATSVFSQLSCFRNRF